MGRRRLAQILAAVRSDLSWRFARPGAFRQRFEQAVANMPQGMCLYDADDRLQLVNEQFCRIYNQPMTRLHTGMTLYEVLADSCAIGNYPGRSVDDIYSARKTFIDRREKGTFLQELGDGRLIAIYHQPLADGGWVCTYEDITERRRAEARIEFLAHHDGLTELPNRVLFTERLDRAIADASATHRCALLCLDLDGFKEVNDRFGHTAGDQLLKNVAMRLRDCIRDADTPARLGGDEFAVVLPDTSPEEALQVADRIAAALRRPYFMGVLGTAEIATSVGIAWAPDHAARGDELLLMADKALYVSKNARRGLPVLFDDALKTSPAGLASLDQATSFGDFGAGGRRRLADDLAAALREGRLGLHYQPIYDAASGRPVVLEALARWNDPLRGAVAPLEFVRVAEEFGSIGRLTEWALSTACREASRWSDGLKVGVNLSPLNLHDAALPETVARIVRESGLAPSRLVLEITEGSAIDQSPEIIERLHALRSIGAELWLDDFGSGYANFEYLRHMLCDVVKIDRSFLASYGKRRELLGGMIALAQRCGLRVVAEGIESPEDHDLVRDLGCDLLQGFLLAQPLPPEQLEGLLAPNVPFQADVSIVPAMEDSVGARSPRGDRAQATTPV